MQKNAVSWMLVTLGSLGTIVSYYGIWLMAAYWATGLSWCVNLALMISGPVGAAGACLALRRPRQWGAFWLGALAAFAWTALWVLCFTVFGFRYVSD